MNIHLEKTHIYLQVFTKYSFLQNHWGKGKGKDNSKGTDISESHFWPVNEEFSRRCVTYIPSPVFREFVLYVWILLTQKGFPFIILAAESSCLHPWHCLVSSWLPTMFCFYNLLFLYVLISVWFLFQVLLWDSPGKRKNQNRRKSWFEQWTKVNWVGNCCWRITVKTIKPIFRDVLFF